MSKRVRPTVRAFAVPALILALGASLLSNVFLVNRDRERMRVTSVHDGDTFTLAGGDRVRLLGADAPETGRCIADKAKTRLEELVLGNVVRLTEEKRDTYGRRMGLIYVGTTLVNEVMIAEGLARPDYTANTRNETLKAAYREASEEKRGIHSSECKKISPTPPSKNCVIKGNIDKASWDKLYHLPTCRHYNQIVLDEDIGEGFFCSEKEAQDAGFRLAPDCLR